MTRSRLADIASLADVQSACPRLVTHADDCESWRNFQRTATYCGTGRQRRTETPRDQATLERVNPERKPESVVHQHG
jgi:hypothetical protein